MNHIVSQKEKDIAAHDRLLIQKIFKEKNAIFNPVQPILLDYVSDPFIDELLPNLTKYMSLVRDKSLSRQAYLKLTEIMTQLRNL